MHKLITTIHLTAALLLASCDISNAISDNDEAEKQSNFRGQVESAVRKALRDPESARFEEVLAFPDDDVACGKVNAKNGFGGYTGAESFAYSDGRVALESGDSSTWINFSKLCSHAIDKDSIARLNRTRGLLATSSMSDEQKQKEAEKITREITKLNQRQQSD